MTVVRQPAIAYVLCYDNIFEVASAAPYLHARMRRACSSPTAMLWGGGGGDARASSFRSQAFWRSISTLCQIVGGVAACMAAADTLEALLGGPEEEDGLSDRELSDAPLDAPRCGAAGSQPVDLLEEGELPSERREAEASEEAAGGGEAAAEAPEHAPKPLPPRRLYSGRVKIAAQQLARALGEKKVHVLRELCARFGVPLALSVLNDALVLMQEEGGATTADGSRLRTAGGTFLSLFRTRVEPAEWREHLRAIKKIEASMRRT